MTWSNTRRKMAIGGSIWLSLALSAGTVQSEIRIALDMPPDPKNSGTYVFAKSFHDYLNARNLKSKLYPRGALGEDSEVLDLVSQGLVEVVMGPTFSAAKLDKFANGFMMPYLWQSVDHFYDTATKSDLVARLNEGTTRKGVRVYPLIAGGFLGIFNTKRPVAKIEDLNGIRLRAISPSDMKYFAQLGVRGIIIPWSEVSTALQTGMVDGYMNPPLVPLVFGHVNQLKYFTDIRQQLTVRVALISEQWYQSLKGDARKIVDEAIVVGRSANRDFGRDVFDRNLERLKKAGVTVVKPNAAEEARFRKAGLDAAVDGLSDAEVELFRRTAARYLK